MPHTPRSPPLGCRGMSFQERAQILVSAKIPDTYELVHAARGVFEMLETSLSYMLHTYKEPKIVHPAFCRFHWLEHITYGSVSEGEIVAILKMAGRMWQGGTREREKLRSWRVRAEKPLISSRIERCNSGRPLSGARRERLLLTVTDVGSQLPGPQARLDL
ncbi:hypothetical protein NEUTE2DRAFT_127068 [Neurospora tetrasperma FGSC 2509]|nr:hypothetical protein NEUTE2DRAFT_127068 [Neurospora tetrasperma FGSC 2509]